jgi:hypothetical protein
METKPLSECTARERTERVKAAHQSMVAERAAAFRDDGASPREAYNRASAMQLPVSNQVRESIDR